ncbi:MAG: hypothetical protein QW201_02280 [Thermoproteota archaeon]
MKCLVFTAIMSAMGNVLSAISILLVPIAPAIPIGPITISISLDLSHLATFLSAIRFGPSIGGLTGLISGLVASYEYGFSKGNIINGFAIPPGKAITGIIAGLLFKVLSFSKRERRYLLILLPPVAYLPEAVYTAFVFLVMLPQVAGVSSAVFYPILVVILTKAWIEMLILGFLLMAITSSGVMNFSK